MTDINELSLGPHFAQTHSARPSFGIRLWEFRYAPWQRIPSHSHAAAYVCFLIAGELIETDGSEELTYANNRAVYVPVGKHHAARAGPEGALVSGFELSGDTWRLNELAPSLPNRVTQLRSPDANLTIQRAMLHSRLSDDRLLHAGWPFDVVSNLLPTPGRESNQWFEQLISYLQDMHSQAITIEELARLADRHPAHLMRSFRSRTGTTIGSYLQKLRLDSAAQALCTSNQPISTIAARCGFADQSHLARLFRQKFKLTPSSYRSAFQNDPVASRSG